MAITILSNSSKRKSEFGTSGPSRCKCTNCSCNSKNNSDMHDKQSEDLIHYYTQESKKDQKADKAKKKLYNKKRFKKNVPINHQKLQWLQGEGPQTD